MLLMRIPALAFFLCLATQAAAQDDISQPDLSGNNAHWRKLDNADCWIYDPRARAGWTADWTGQCVNRLASGRGTVTWKYYTGQLKETAAVTLVNGVEQKPAQTPPAIATDQPSPMPSNTIDAAKLAEIADIAKFDKTVTAILGIPWGVSQAGQQYILQDPTAEQVDTKIAIADSFYYRSYMRTGNKLAWETNLSSLNDVATARRWYQMALKQWDQLHPDARSTSGEYFNSRPSWARTYERIRVHQDGLITLPDEATVAIYRARIQQTQQQAQRQAEQAQLQAEHTQKLASEKAAAFQSALPGLHAARKEVGDTVCNSDNEEIGQVDRVDHNKILVREHWHRNGFVNSYAGVAMAGQDWDEKRWMPYNKVIQCQ